jgi:CRP-like cAMP-binding protein
MCNDEVATACSGQARHVDPVVPLQPAKNRLLRRIPPGELSVLLAAGDEVELRPRQVLHHWRLPMEHIYFVSNGLISVSAKVDETRFVEAWLIGSEGMLGAPYVLAPDDTSPPHRRVVQVGGSALRISATTFITALQTLPVLREMILRYINVVLLQTSQSGACNALHSVKQRLARWLLVARSALDRDDLAITHAMLAQLLGIRRASVSECLEKLEREGLIRNARASIAILDQVALEQTACSCFGLIQREYDRQIGRFTSPST